MPSLADPDDRRRSGVSPGAAGSGAESPGLPAEQAGDRTPVHVRRTHGDLAENTSKNTHNVVERLLRECTTRGKVLDVPCGSGVMVARLLKAGHEAYGADLRGSIKVPGAKYARADMQGPLPYTAGELDAVLSIDGIEHIERPFDFIRECGRIVRPGGSLILSTPNISALRSRWRWLFTGFHNKGKVPLDETNPRARDHINLLPFHELRYMLHSNGFCITAVETNRVKPISWLYAPLVPAAMLWTRIVFLREEKDPAQRTRNREIVRQMFSVPVLFGETLILRARRET